MHDYGWHLRSSRLTVRNGRPFSKVHYSADDRTNHNSIGNRFDASCQWKTEPKHIRFYPVSWNNFVSCHSLHILLRTILLVTIFSQYMAEVYIPVPRLGRARHPKKYAKFFAFKMFGVSRFMNTYCICVLFFSHIRSYELAWDFEEASQYPEITFTLRRFLGIIVSSAWLLPWSETNTIIATACIRFSWRVWR